jgi:hypothetical protein
MMILPQAANLSPAAWQTGILASEMWAGTVPRA